MAIYAMFKIVLVCFKVLLFLPGIIILKGFSFFHKMFLVYLNIL
jgi:hypothetical protein